MARHYPLILSAGRERLLPAGDGLLGAPSTACLIPVSGDLMLTTNGAGTTTGTLIGAANRMELYPWLCPVDVSAQAFVVNVTTAVASALGKVIIYGSDSNGRSDLLLFESASLNLGTTGNKTATGALSFKAGETYWFGFRHSSTATMSTWPPNATPDINGGTAAVTTKRSKLQRTLTFATGAPASWAFLSSEITNAAPTAVWIKKS